MSHYFLVIDAGTGSIRAIVFDTFGNQTSIAQYEWNHLCEEGVAGLPKSVSKNPLRTLI
jgi:autoinducer 2 (AI-2) kinase